MAALLTLLAIVAGGVVGLTHGGRIDRILEYRPQLWPALAGGLFLQLVIRVAGPPAGTRSDWRCPAPAALAHLRIGGGTHGVADGAAAVALDFLLQR